MKKSIIAVMTFLALGASSVYAEDGGDRVHQRSMEHMKVAMESHKAQQDQLASTAQVESTKIQK